MGENNYIRLMDILLVEDNPGDVRLTREALREGKFLNRLHVAPDGVEALAFLRRGPGHESAPRPDLILLDLNLPKKSGLEVLAEIKNDPDLQIIPVIILTSSQAEEDIVKAYRSHANCYIAKPVNLEAFLQVVLSIENFWLGLAKIPAN